MPLKSMGQFQCKSIWKVTFLWKCRWRVNIRWKHKLPLKIHCNMPLTIHDYFWGVDFWCAVFWPWPWVEPVPFTSEQFPNHRHRNLKACEEHVQTHVFSRFITESCLYNFSGLGVRVVWKLFNEFVVFVTPCGRTGRRCRSADTQHQGRAVRDMQRGPDHPEGSHTSRWCLDFSARAGLHVFPLTYHWEVSSEAQTYLRRSSYSSPHLAPLTASRQQNQGYAAPWAYGMYEWSVDACMRHTHITDGIGTPDPNPINWLIGVSNGIVFISHVLN